MKASSNESLLRERMHKTNNLSVLLDGTALGARQRSGQLQEMETCEFVFTATWTFSSDNTCAMGGNSFIPSAKSKDREKWLLGKEQV